MELGCSPGSPSVQDVYGTTHLQHKRWPSCPQHNIVYASVAGAGVVVEVNKAAGWRWTGCGGGGGVPTYSQHTVNIQSTYSQHPVNIQSTSPVFILLLSIRVENGVCEMVLLKYLISFIILNARSVRKPKGRSTKAGMLTVC